MAINFDQAAATAMLKEMYDLPAMQNLVYASHPTWALLQKRGGEGGRYTRVPLQIGNSQGYASTVQNAIDILQAADLKAFNVTLSTLISLANIDGLTLESSMTSKQSFAKGVKVLVDSAVSRLANAVSSGIFRTKEAFIGDIGSIGVLGTGVIQLSEPADIVQYEVGQTLNAYSTAGVLRAGVGRVLSVDRSNGRMTVGASTTPITQASVFTLGTPTGWVATDKLVSYGTYNLGLSGLGGWLPKVAPTAGDNYFGVDRSVDVTRLAGVRYDGTTQSVKDAVISAIALVAREGGTPSHCVLDFESYNQLALDLQSNVIYTDLSGPGKISFSGFKFQGPTGPVLVIADRDCPPKTAYLLQMDTVFFIHANEGEPIFVDDNGGAGAFRTLESQDARQVRVKMYGQIACNAPGWNAVVSLSS